MFCKNCGSENLNSARFCKNCGSPTKNSGQENYTNNPKTAWDYYLTVLKKYAVFSGRASRREYWMFILFNIVFLIVATIIDNVLGTVIVRGSYYGWFYYSYSLIVLVPSLAVTVRRLHDTGKSGGMCFIALIPLVGYIVLLVLMATEGTPGMNKYGPNPKNRERLSEFDDDDRSAKNEPRPLVLVGSKIYFPPESKQPQKQDDFNLRKKVIK